MNRGIKAIGILFSVLLMSVLLMVIAISSPYLTLPFGIRRNNFLMTTLSNDYFRQYLFWLALVFAVVVLIFILFLIFYPKGKQTFVLKENKGRLSFSKQAIEGFVRSKIEGVGFVDSPQVKVRATKNKIKVKVKGNLNRTSAHIGKTGTLMEDIQKELQEILGSREQVKVDVTYTSFEEHQTTENQSRVK
ncbi:alkaline shock response membrane anchor protein AmaP (plasmid) [Enterococcus gilvus]|jgi:4-amino-4-deoxy-L-arabinose transferase-like glycosyltransferase|uniref:alkaline shock response membrane anchor protein AmaP n=1 Tax=Enterococcus gilvus TaxID=160453 RepID=UPI000DF6346B|nr:alkaline shock response membrane anchor protein AmaP [Enterococcus gilvus]AXG40133.1 alkaline shock response membrane anchor protein AmaP [Enterococcus gilvus]